jgi:hypothetical protein
MNRKRLLIPLLVMFTLPWIVASAVTDSVQQTTVHGELGIAEEDDDGNVTRVYVYDLDRGSVLVADTAKGRELIRHLGSRVKVEGKLAESADPAYDWMIEVTAFAIQDEDEYPDDPDDPA